MTTQQLNIEVITVLASENAYWDPCCGPNGNGISSADLLSQLIVAYPDSEWTEIQLKDILTGGIRRGRYKQLPEDVYYINQNMIRVNNSNSVYAVASNNICTARSCERPFSVIH